MLVSGDVGEGGEHGREGLLGLALRIVTIVLVTLPQGDEALRIEPRQQLHQQPVAQYPSLADQFPVAIDLFDPSVDRPVKRKRRQVANRQLLCRVPRSGESRRAAPEAIGAARRLAGRFDRKMNRSGFGERFDEDPWRAAVRPPSRRLGSGANETAWRPAGVGAGRLIASGKMLIRTLVGWGTRLTRGPPSSSHASVT